MKLFSLMMVTGLFFATPTQADQPNILFIYLDDFGWNSTSYMGSDFFETPNLDKLAKGGMVFSDAYSCAANCAPARACLLSGQYTPRHEIYNVGTRPRGKTAHRRLQHVPGVSTLDTNIKTWAHQLKSAGYRTATIGKWHLSKDPIPYGFDINIGGTHSGSPPKGYYPPHPKVPGLGDASKDEYLTDRLSNEAIKFITENKNQRWCVYLTHFAIHTPLDAKRELLAKYAGKPKGKLHDHVAVATMIESVDQGVGAIMNQLDELKLRDNTVVIFYSDNGGYGPATDMKPLKGYKGTYYEGGVRVPFFVNWPGKVKPEGKCSEPITGVDFFPTLCRIGSAALPTNQPIDGVDLVDLFTGKSDKLKERSLFWHFPAYLQSYAGTHDEQRDVLFRSRPCSVIRSGPWKLHQFFESGDLELYNLEQDIGETTNLAQAHPERTQKLLSKLQDWQATIGAPNKFKPNPEFNANKESAAIAKKKSKSRY